MRDNTLTNAPDILTLKEAALWLRVNEIWLQRAARKGEIPSFKIGRRVYFQQKKLCQWLQQQQKG